MEYAQLAESLAEGRGLTTRTIWILRTAYTTDLPAADLRRPPLLPLLQAMLFRATGESSDRNAILAAGFPFVLIPPLLFLLARRWVPLPLALGGAVLSMLDPVMLHFVDSGLTEPLFALIMLALGAVLALQNPWAAAIAGGVLLGIGQYTRSNAFTLIAPVLLVLWLRSGAPRERLRWCGAALAVFLAVTAPHLLRNVHHIGRADFTGYQSAVIANDIGGTPEHFAERVFEPISPLAVLIADPAGLAAKVWDYGVRNTEAALVSTSPVAIGLAFAILLLGCLDPVQRRLGLFSLAALVWSVLFFSVGEFQGPRFYVPFAPLIILTATLTVAAVVRQREGSATPRWQAAALIFVLAVALLPGLGRVVRKDPVDPTAIGSRVHFGQAIRNAVAEGDVITSDVPWVIGRYTGRTGVWLPLRIEELPQLEARLPVRWICLSPSLYRLDYIRPEWREVYEGRRVIPGYRRAQAIQGGFVLFERETR